MISKKTSSAIFTRGDIHNDVIVYLCKYDGKNYLVKYDMQCSQSILVRNYFDRYLSVDSNNILYTDRGLFFWDEQGRTIQCYDEDTNEIKKIDLHQYYTKEKLQGKSILYEHDDFLFLITYDNPRIIVIEKDMNVIFKKITLEMTSFIDICKNDKLVAFLDESGERIKICRLDNFDLQTVNISKKIKKISVSRTGKLVGVAGDGDVLRINNDGKLEKFFCAECEVQSLIYLEDKILYLGDDIYIYNTESLECKKYNEYPEDLSLIGPEKWYKYYCLFEDEEYIYFPPRVWSHMLRINKKNAKFEWIRMGALAKDDLVMLYKTVKPSIVIEGVFGLEDFIKVL